MHPPPWGFTSRCCDSTLSQPARLRGLPGVRVCTGLSRARREITFACPIPPKVGTHLCSNVLGGPHTRTMPTVQLDHLKPHEPKRKSSFPSSTPLL